MSPMQQEEMVRFLVEMDGRSVDIRRLPEGEVRDAVHPMAERLAARLLHVSEPLEVIFRIDDGGTLSLQLRGSAVAVNEAQDAIGGQMLLSPRLN